MWKTQEIQEILCGFPQGKNVVNHIFRARMRARADNRARAESENDGRSDLESFVELLIIFNS